MLSSVLCRCRFRLMRRSKFWLHSFHECLLTRTESATTWKKSRFILSERSCFHMVDNLPIASYIFPMNMLILLSVDEMWPPMYAYRSTSFKGLSLKGEMYPSSLKRMNSILCTSTRKTRTHTYCSVVARQQGFSFGRCI